MKAVAVSVAMIAVTGLGLLAGCGPERDATVTSASRSGELRFLGQPSAGEFAEMRADGIDVVVNLRPDSEMDWDEAATARAAGLEYHAVPIARSGPAFDRTSIDRISSIVDANPDRNIALHCSSGNRVSAWYAIYLVQQQGLSLEEALQRARASGLTRPELEQRIKAYLGES